MHYNLTAIIPQERLVNTTVERALDAMLYPYGDQYAEERAGQARARGELQRDDDGEEDVSEFYRYAMFDAYGIGDTCGWHWRVRPGAPIRCGLDSEKRHPLRSDIVKISEIDFDAVAEEHGERLERFRTQWWNAIGGSDEAFEEVRESSTDIGLLRAFEASAPPMGGEVLLGVAPWQYVARLVTDADYYRVYAPKLYPLVTSVVLDTRGWHRIDRCEWAPRSPFNSSYDPADYRDRFMARAASDDLFVIVDMHT